LENSAQRAKRLRWQRSHPDHGSAGRHPGGVSNSAQPNVDGFEYLPVLILTGSLFVTGASGLRFGGALLWSIRFLSRQSICTIPRLIASMSAWVRSETPSLLNILATWI